MIPIEYIGPTPKKKPKKPILGGWVILCLAALFVSYFAWPHFGPTVIASQVKTSTSDVQQTAKWLKQTQEPGHLLAAAALERTELDINYDRAYYRIDYPMGDIPSHKGIAADLLIRSYRSLDTDLQQLVIEDMRRNYRAYPQLWSQQKPDPCIDHRRNQNLARFFQRHATTQKPTIDASQYEFGDIVFWELPHGPTHLGIVVPGPAHLQEEKWIVHNAGEGPVWEKALFDHKIVGHYRY